MTTSRPFVASSDRGTGAGSGRQANVEIKISMKTNGKNHFRNIAL
jgi:hypothetical protein